LKRSIWTTKGLEISERRTVVIVDDEADVRYALRTLCAALELEVAGEAEDGIEAIPLVASKRPDIVLLDEVMPRLGGAEAANVLRQIAPGLRIIGLAVGHTGRADWCHAWLLKTELDRLDEAIEPLFASIRFEEGLEEVRTEARLIRDSFKGIFEDWDRISDARRRNLTAQAGRAFDGLEKIVERLAATAREGIPGIAPSKPLDAIPPRVRLTGASAEKGAIDYRARVSLQHGPKIYLGDGTAPTEDRSVVEATIRALGRLTAGPVGLVDVAVHEMGESSMAVVVVDVGDTHLAGSAIVRKDHRDAIARATLDALNRWIATRPKERRTPARTVLSR
jgi:CheY-like chemotaxis protein